MSRPETLFQWMQLVQVVTTHLLGSCTLDQAASMIMLLRRLNRPEDCDWEDCMRALNIVANHEALLSRQSVSGLLMTLILKDPHSSVRFGAMWVLGKLTQERLGRYTEQIVQVILKDEALAVRSQAWLVLSRRGLGSSHSDQLATHRHQLILAFFKLMGWASESQPFVAGDPDSLCWHARSCEELVEATLRELLRPSSCSQHVEQAAAIATCLREEFFDADMDRMVPVPVLALRAHVASALSSFVASPRGRLHLPQSFATLATWKTDESQSDTLLHVAARAGSLCVCKVLVEELHVPLRELNSKGEEPLDVASTHEVDRYLRSGLRRCLAETRFATGDASAQALADKGWVEQVTWYTTPLPGAAGKLGGLHSFVVVTLGKPGSVGLLTDGSHCRKYVLEKARPAADAAHDSNLGVFIGTWQGLGGVLTSNATVFRTLAPGDLRSYLTMTELHMAMGSRLGPYSLATANCHHGAQAAFNHCCREDRDWVSDSELPNRYLACLAPLADFGGSWTSESTSGCLTVASPRPSAGSEKADFCQHSMPSGFAPLGRAAAASSQDADVSCQQQLTVEAASLSLLVYNDWSEVPAGSSESFVLTPFGPLPKADLDNVITVCNRLDTAALILPRANFSALLLEPGKQVQLMPSALEGIFSEDFSEKTKWRIACNSMITALVMRTGCAYELRWDHKHVPVAAEVPRHRIGVEILHFAQKTATRPAQWLLARSRLTDAIFIVFRGTDDVQDVCVDIGAVPLSSEDTPIGLGVHSSIFATLRQNRSSNVMNEIQQELLKHQGPQCLQHRIVVCGHSLGGAYAQIVGAHLLDMSYENVRVLTFGAPHVLVPPAEDHTAEAQARELWRKLSSCSQHWVHAWDPVPRLPLCRHWMTDVIGHLKKEKLGFKVGIDFNRLLGMSKAQLEERLGLFAHYDVAGEIVMVSKGNYEAHSRRPDEARSQKELLRQVPPTELVTVGKLFAFHSMEDYLSIITTVLPEGPLQSRL